jgi:uncharacterized protein (DUF58 family)
MIQSLCKWIDQHTRHKRGIYLFPNQRGLIFLSVIAIIFYMGISYANNMMLMLSFFLFSYLIVLLTLAHFNLYRQVWIHPMVEDSRCGEASSLSLVLRPSALMNPRDVRIVFPSQREHLTFQSFIDQRLSAGRVVFIHRGASRGHYYGTHLKVVSSYPLGLFYVWSYLPQSLDFYIYPRRISLTSASLSCAENVTAEWQKSNRLLFGIGDYYDLRRHQNGPLKSIDWKSYAKSNQLWEKVQAQFQEQVINLNWSDFPEMQKEERLSVLGALVEECFKRQMRWTLCLPQQFISSGSGRQHYQACQRALSCYE